MRRIFCARRHSLVSDEEAAQLVPDVVGGRGSGVVCAGDEMRCRPVFASFDGPEGIPAEDLPGASETVKQHTGRLTSSPGLWKNSGERNSVTIERPIARLCGKTCVQMLVAQSRTQ